MAKNDKSKVNKAAIEERNTVNQQHNQFLDTVNTNMAGQTKTANDQNEFATSGYKDIYNRGGLDPVVAENLRKLNRTNSNAFGSSASGGGESSGGGGGESGGGGGGGVVQPPKDMFGVSRNAFQNFINSGGVDIGAMKEALGGFRDISTTGGFSAEDQASIRDAATRSSDIGKTGGFDPEQLGLIRGDIGKIRGIADTGGYDVDQLAKLRGDVTGMREFSAMGGLTPEEISNMRTQSVAPIQGLARAQRTNIDTLSRVNPGINRAATLAKAARGNAQALGEQAASTEGELAKLMSANRIRGLESASTAGRGLESDVAGKRASLLYDAATGTTNLEDKLTQNRLVGTKQGADLLSGLNNDMASNKLTALGGITDTQQGAEQIAQQGKIAGAQGMFGVEQADQAAADAAANRTAAAAASSGYNDAISRAAMAEDEQFWAKFNAGNEQYIGDASLGGQLSALGGIGNLYGTAPGAQGQNYNAALGAMGQRSGAAQGALGTQLQSAGPSGWDRFMQVAGMAAPVATAFMPGAGGATVSKKRPTASQAMSMFQ